MTVADAHLHLFGRGYPGIYGRSLLAPEPEVYEAFRAAHGIVAGLVVGYQGEGIDPHNNSHIRALAADRPWMETVAHVEARAAVSAESVTALLEAGHRGVSIYAADAGEAGAVADWGGEAWRVLEHRRAIVSLNVSAELLPHIDGCIGGYGGCTFLVSHMGMPHARREPPDPAEARELLAPLLRLSRAENVLVKLSGAYAISDPPHAFPHAAARPFATAILDRFGPERCLWGSDFSPALDHVSFAQTLSCSWIEELDGADRALVMGGNLLRLLGRESSVA